MCAGSSGYEIIRTEAVTESKSEKTPVYKELTNATFPPFDTIDENTGEIIGFDMDLIAAIGEDQGFQVEFDDTDNISWHLAVYDGDEPIGAARIFLGEDKVWQIGRVCVLENYRGRKLGDKILEACEQKIVELAKGPAQAHLSAQVQAKGFYKKHGYTESGEEYLDEFCPHISMTKQLS